MADVEVSYKGNTIGSLSATGSLTLETEGKYCEDDIGISYTKPSGGGSNWELVGTKTFSNLSEYTGTTAEENDTQISVSSLSYSFLLVIVTCDSAIQTSTEWGMSVQVIGRQTSGGTVAGQSIQQRGSATLTQSAQVNHARASNSDGVYIKTAASSIIMVRKCSTTTPKCRSGNYTVKVYGMTAL